MEMLIINNTKRNRFETEINGKFAYLDYEFFNGVMNLFHTFVPPKDRHQGIAFALVEFALEYAKSEHLKVIAGCPTVSIYIEQHPEYETLLD
jgi:predicted GNAT family acetyltransferase